MLDIYLAGDLFDSVKPGSQLILIGDADQLPICRTRAVLSEMIRKWYRAGREAG